MLFAVIQRYQLSFEQVPYQEKVPMGSNVEETTGIDIVEDRAIEIAAVTRGAPFRGSPRALT